VIPIPNQTANINILALFNIINHTLIYLRKDQDISTNTRIIQAIRRFPHYRQIELSDYLSIPLPSVSMALGRMQDRGLVTLKRKSPPVLTELGEKYYQPYFKKLEKDINGTFNKLPKKEKQLLKSTFIELAELCYPNHKNEEWDMSYAYFDVLNHFTSNIVKLTEDLNGFYRTLTLMYLSATRYLTSEDIKTLICVYNIDTIRIMFTKLEKDNMITRKTDPMLISNYKRIEITDKGREYYKEKSEEINTKWNGILLGPYSNREYTTRLFHNYANINQVAQSCILPKNPLNSRAYEKTHPDNY